MLDNIGSATTTNESLLEILLSAGVKIDFHLEHRQFARVTTVNEPNFLPAASVLMRVYQTKAQKTTIFTQGGKRSAGL